MFNFSGVLYRIWGVCGVILVLGVACILLNRPWARKVKIKDCKQRWTRGYKRYKETSGLIEWKERQIFHSIFT